MKEDQVHRYVYSGEVRVRLDQFLSSAAEGSSRSQLQRLIDGGLVTVNGEVVKASTKLRPGDVVVLRVPPAEPARALPQDIPLTILYEDSHLVVVDKPAGMVVHPAPGHSDGTLVNALLAHCTDLSGVGGELRPGIVHRIDKDTSGILVVSKDDRTHAALSDGFKDKRHEREYLAVVAPAPPGAGATLSTLHGRHPVHRKKFSSKVSRGKPAITHYEVVERFGGGLAALLRVRLETGRTHQIRVHCADSGFAIVADPVYARRPKHERLRSLAEVLGRQALHARLLGFRHPITGEDLRFESPIPPDMMELLRGLRALGP